MSQSRGLDDENGLVHLTCKFVCAHVSVPAYACLVLGLTWRSCRYSDFFINPSTLHLWVPLHLALGDQAPHEPLIPGTMALWDSAASEHGSSLGCLSESHQSGNNPLMLAELISLLASACCQASHRLYRLQVLAEVSDGLDSSRVVRTILDLCILTFLGM